MSVACGKAVFKELQKVNLAAGHSQRVKIHVMYVNIALFVSLYMLRIDNIHLVEFLSALRAVFEHSAHGSITVNVGILTLYIVIFSFLESKVLIYLHEFGVHVPYSCTFRSVKNVLLGCSCMSVFYENFFYSILNLFYSRHVVMTHFQKIQLNLLSQIHCHLPVTAAENLCRFKNGVGYFIDVKIYSPAVSFYDFLNAIHIDTFLS